MDIEKSHINLKTVVIIVVSAISMTFTLTTIYWRFNETEIEIKELREDLLYNKDRADRLRKRLETRVDLLEEPNTDKTEQ